MVALEIRFPAGRLHATPWGRHVNEGAVEWPPSPWRILRALVATWHLKARDAIPERLMRRLIDRLASSLPEFALPRASTGHTRHYMPIIEGRKEKTTKVFDTFVHVDGPLVVAWQLDLDDELNHALSRLCRDLGYFGRAETLVEVRVNAEQAADVPNARPLPANEPIPEGHELIRLLCPQTPDAYLAWRSQQQATSASDDARPRKRGRGKKAASPAMPQDLFDALHLETADLQKAGWTVPPGAQWVDYVRPSNCFAVAPRSRLPRRGSKLTVARFAVSSVVLPRITDAVSVAERIHQALLARFKDNGPPPPVLSGRDPAGQPMEGHRHVHIFCESNGPRDAITHVTLYARQGFDVPSRRAIESLQKVWGHGGHDLQLVLLGLGDENTFVDCRLFGPAAVWRSVTPFVPTRHPKTHRDGRPKLDADGWWIGSPEHDLRRLIAEAGLPLPTRIERLSHIAIHSRRLRPIQFQTRRYHGDGRRAVHAIPVAFELTFPEPITGPLAFGYAAHFGLGLFVPVSHA